MYISIEGNIGSGKSTIWKALQERHPDWTFVKEPVDEWIRPTQQGPSMLDLFYKDMDAQAQPFQIQALSTRAQCLHEGLAKGSKIVVSERCPLTDKNIFQAMNKAKFSDCEKHAYEHLQTILNVKEPDLIVYLKCEPEVCLERIHKRAREGEDPISLDYLSELHTYHERMSERSNIAVVPTNTHDIDSIVNQVDDAIRVFGGIASRNRLQDI